MVVLCRLVNLRIPVRPLATAILIMLPSMVNRKLLSNVLLRDSGLKNPSRHTLLEHQLAARISRSRQTKEFLSQPWRLNGQGYPRPCFFAEFSVLHQGLLRHLLMELRL